MPLRQRVIPLALIIVATVIAAPGALAQADSAGPAAEYPNRTVRFVVPIPPGGSADTVARTVAQKLGDAWGQPVVVDNRAGANGIIATELVAKSKPDGYTVLLALATHAINPMLYPNLPYDSSRDFAPVTVLAEYPFGLVVHPSLPAGSVKELIALARAKPAQLSYATSGTGSGPHLGIELFKSMARIDLVHVPYRGAGPGLIDLIAGQVQLS
jgi:tripartite-type tricarboxylate transporter receptor subunit TctC